MVLMMMVTITPKAHPDGILQRGRADLPLTLPNDYDIILVARWPVINGRENLYSIRATRAS